MNELLRLLLRQLEADVRALPAELRRGRTGRQLDRCVNIAELRRLARRRVPLAAFDFGDGGAADEITMRRNVEDFAELVLNPRALVDVSSIDLSTSVLGQPVDVPLLGGPTGLTGLIHHRGEIGIARAVHRFGSVYVLSAMASHTIEEVAAAAPGPKWFQLYVWRDRGFVRELLDRARAAGYRALVLTVDVQMTGPRERDRRNGFGLPPRLTLRSLGEGLLRPGWSLGFLTRPRITIANAVGYSGVADDARTLTEYVTSQFDPSLDWEDLASLREAWDGPLVVKGILNPEDALQAVRLGSNAVVVSNHGGRQLDHAPSSIAALPAVVDAVGGEAEVYLDGGVRRGSDVVKALALGARACLVVRPLVYGLGAGGEAGAGRAMELLVDELRLTMTLLGCRAVGELDRSFVERSTTSPLPS